MSVPAPHKRILPHMEISEQGLRELEIWLLDKLRGAGKCALLFNVPNGVPPRCHGWLYVRATGTGGPHNKSIELFAANSMRLVAGSDMAIDSFNLVLTAGGEFRLTSLFQEMQLTSNAGIILIDRNVENTIRVVMDGNVGGGATDLNVIEANGGGTKHDAVVLRMFDSITNDRYVSIKKADDTVLFRVANDSHTIHNLDAGKTLIVNDGSGNPILTLTG